MQEINIDGKFEVYYFLIRMELLTCIYDKIKNRQMDFSEKKHNETGKRYRPRNQGYP